MKKYKWFLYGIMALLLLSACSKQEEDIQNVEVEEEPIVETGFVAEYDWPLATFEAQNQDLENVTLETYKGQPWVMNMIFTNCTTVCLPMTANMAKLQQMLKEENVNAPLVSFSVDPTIDSPDVLKSYAQKYEADLSNWDFLTGYTEDDIKRIAKSVKTLAEKPAGEDQVTHSTKFFLINSDGIAVKGYDGVNPPYEEIMQDIKTLQ